MITNTQAVTKDTNNIRERIEAVIQAVLPAFNKVSVLPAFNKVSRGFELDHIRVWVSLPRKYMGRFDSGKQNWTIDVAERVTHSRVKQVRVKIGADGAPTFDKVKLLRAVEDLRAAITAHSAEQAKIKERLALLGEDHDMYNVKVKGDCYVVNYSNVFDLEKTKAFLKFIESL